MADNLSDQILFKLGEMDSKLDAVKESVESHEPRIQDLEKAHAAQGVRNGVQAAGFGIFAAFIGDVLLKLWPSSH